jgi:hypothetical protein
MAVEVHKTDARNTELSFTDITFRTIDQVGCMERLNKPLQKPTKLNISSEMTSTETVCRLGELQLECLGDSKM